MTRGKEFPQDRQFEQMIHTVGHENTKGLAYILGVPYSTLAELLNPNNQKRFPAAAIPVLIDAADDNRLIDYLCIRRDLVAVPIKRNDENLDPQEWLKHLAINTRETGDVLAALADAISDGDLDQDEIRNCLSEADEAVAALVALREDLKAALA